MNVVIMQPFYLFLRKHFHQIKRADIYVFMDDTQFVKNSFHNRNRIKGQNGLIWLTVPVIHNYGQKINEVRIDNTKQWKAKHWKSISNSYSKSEYFNNYKDFFEDTYLKNWNLLFELNIYLIKNISVFLGINNTKFLVLSDLKIYNENTTQRLIDICEKTGSDNYIIGTRAKDYMEEERWGKTMVKLEYFEPVYPPYPQLYGNFMENCSIIDLLFNCGKNAGDYIWGEKFKKYNERF